MVWSDCYHQLYIYWFKTSARNSIDTDSEISMVKIFLRLLHVSTAGNGSAAWARERPTPTPRPLSS